MLTLKFAFCIVVEEKPVMKIIPDVTVPKESKYGKLLRDIDSGVE